MKRLWIWMILLLGISVACSREHLAPPEPVMQDGVWTGTGEGRSGTILVKITVLEHRITSIVVVSQSESPFAQDAVNGMIARALEKQRIIGGNGVADIVVNGKIAGQNAAEYAK